MALDVKFYTGLLLDRILFYAMAQLLDTARK